MNRTKDYTKRVRIAKLVGDYQEGRILYIELEDALIKMIEG